MPCAPRPKSGCRPSVRVVGSRASPAVVRRRQIGKPQAAKTELKAADQIAMSPRAPTRTAARPWTYQVAFAGRHTAGVVVRPPAYSPGTAWSPVTPQRTPVAPCTYHVPFEGRQTTKSL